MINTHCTQQASKKDQLIGQTLRDGTYKVQQILGQGGMSTVYLAVHQTSQRSFALKQNRADSPLPENVLNELDMLLATERRPLHPLQQRTPTHPDFPGSGGTHTDSFLREALFLARLHHPAIPALYDYFFEDGYWYLVIEYLPGPTLSTYIQRYAPLPPLEALNYAIQLSDILDYLHQNTPPILYRDLKPANILLTPDGALKLIDFGIARYLTPSHQTGESQEFGSPAYAPPEQYQAEGQADRRSDLFSLGIILYEMLHGKRPTEPEEQKKIFSLTLQGILTLSTHYDPQKRFQSAHLFYLALTRAYDIEERLSYEHSSKLRLEEPGIVLISEQELQQRAFPFRQQPETPRLETEPHKNYERLDSRNLLYRGAQAALLLTLLLTLLLISLLVTERLVPRQTDPSQHQTSETQQKHQAERDIILSRAERGSR